MADPTVKIYCFIVSVFTQNGDVSTKFMIHDNGIQIENEKHCSCQFDIPLIALLQNIGNHNYIFVGRPSNNAHITVVGPLDNIRTHNGGVWWSPTGLN